MLCNIIIPCFNGGGRLLNNNLPNLFDYIKKSNHKFNIYVVNDGSQDNTLEILKSYKNKITVLTYDKNLGKGGAVKYGVLNCAKCDAIIYMDCDFSTDLKAIDESLEKILLGYDFVLGSRFLKDSILPIKRTLKRRIVSKCCISIVNLLFRFNLKDTQCGFKCIKYDILKKIAQSQKENGWSFDIEYLYFAKILNKRILEIPIIWTENSKTTIKCFKASIKFLVSIFKIRLYGEKEIKYENDFNKK